MKPTLLSSKRRRRQRGAAAVEAVISIPIFVIMFGGTIFMGQLYKEKLETWEQSRWATWWLAGFGCDAPGSGQTLPPAEDISLFDTDAIASNHPGVALCDAAFAYMTVPVSGQTSVSGTPHSADVSSQFTLACNERAEAGNFQGGVSYLWNALRQDLDPIPDAGAPPTDPPPPPSNVTIPPGSIYISGPYGYEVY